MSELVRDTRRRGARGHPSRQPPVACLLLLGLHLPLLQVATRNLNKVIDVNYYPIREAEYSNMRHRPIGLGIQGLADCLALMRFPFESEEARVLNRDIFEAIYYGAVTASCELAAVHGPYTTFPGSPASKGILQFDMWGVKPER